MCVQLGQSSSIIRRLTLFYLKKKKNENFKAGTTTKGTFNGPIFRIRLVKLVFFGAIVAMKEVTVCEIEMTTLTKDLTC